VPIRMAVSSRKKIDPNGRFWSTVLSCTGQPRKWRSHFRFSILDCRFLISDCRFKPIKTGLKIGGPSENSHRTANGAMHRLPLLLACLRKTRAQESLVDRAGIRIRSSGGLSTGFEADTCLACDPAPCAEACPTGAFSQRKGGGVIVKKKLCIRCGECDKACPVDAIYLDPTGNPLCASIAAGACLLPARLPCPRGYRGQSSGEKEEQEVS